MTHKAHDSIWLQVDPDGESCDPEQGDLHDEATWCRERINDSDVQYIRADLVESLRQQLAAALAACKLKDRKTQHFLDDGEYEALAEALAIQPDDAALKAWLGKPLAWKDAEARNRAIFPPMKPEEGDDGWIPLYYPKELK